MKNVASNRLFLSVTYVSIAIGLLVLTYLFFSFPWNTRITILSVSGTMFSLTLMGAIFIYRVTKERGDYWAGRIVEKMDEMVQKYGAPFYEKVPSQERERIKEEVADVGAEELEEIKKAAFLLQLAAIFLFISLIFSAVAIYGQIKEVTLCRSVFDTSKLFMSFSVAFLFVASFQILYFITWALRLSFVVKLIEKLRRFT